MKGICKMRNNGLLKKYLCIALTLTLLILSSSCGGSAPASSNTPAPAAPAAAADKIVLKAAHVLAADHPYNLGMMKFNELLQERTDGQISLDIFPSSQLGNERELTEAIQLGTVDIALAAASVVANFNKNFVIYDLPFLFEDREHAYKFLDGELGKVYLDELAQYKMIGLGYWETGFSKLVNSKRAISTPDQVAGLNIRTMESAPYMTYFSELGANPVPMGWGDIYTSLQNGTIDGLTNPITAIYTSRLNDVAKFLSKDDSHYCPIVMLMSPSTYEKLTPEQQQIVRECEEEARKYERQCVLEGEDRLYKAFEDEGGTIVDLDRSVWMTTSAVQAVYDSIVPSIIPADVIEKCKALQ